jgi:hypothetical protein
MKKVIKRELEVMFDKDAQPVGFRIAKWTAYVGLAYLLRGRRWFWTWVVGLPGAGMIMHLIYRWKTNGWTQSWGGWKYN